MVSIFCRKKGFWCIVAQFHLQQQFPGETFPKTCAEHRESNSSFVLSSIVITSFGEDGATCMSTECDNTFFFCSSWCQRRAVIFDVFVLFVLFSSAAELALADKVYFDIALRRLFKD